MNNYPFFFFMSDSFNPELISTSKFVEMYYEGIVEPYCEGVEYEEYVRVKLKRRRTQWIKSRKG